MTDYLNRRLRPSPKRKRPTPPTLYLYANKATRQVEKLPISQAVTRRRDGERLEMIDR